MLCAKWHSSPPFTSLSLYFSLPYCTSSWHSDLHSKTHPTWSAILHFLTLFSSFSFTLQTWQNCLYSSHPGLPASAYSSFYCSEMAWARSSSRLSWEPRSCFISWHQELICFPSRHTNHRCEVCGLLNIPSQILSPYKLVRVPRVPLDKKFI